MPTSLFEQSLKLEVLISFFKHFYVILRIFSSFSSHQVPGPINNIKVENPMQL